MPLKDFPPHLYLIFLKIDIFLKGFFSLYEIGFTSFLFIHPFENLKKPALLPMTFIFELNDNSSVFLFLFGNL